MARKRREHFDADDQYSSAGILRHRVEEGKRIDALVAKEKSEKGKGTRVPAKTQTTPVVQAYGLTCARELTTLGPTHIAWELATAHAGATLLAQLKAHVALGAIVRVQPSAVVSDTDIERIRDALRGHAAAIKVMPRLPSDAVVTQVMRESPTEVLSLREVVREMGSEAVTQDRGALMLVLDEALSKVGL
jgi:hypothetical protein